MSAANTALVQELYGAFAKGDVEAVLGALAPDVEWGEPENPFNPAGGTRHGHAGVVEWLTVGRDAEEILVLEPRRFLAADDVVAVVGFTRCRVRTTGKTYETDFVHVITVQEGRITRFQEFFDTFAAAEAFKP